MSRTAFPGLYIVLGIVGLVTVIYWPTVASMAVHWNHDGYRHAPLIPFVFLWLLWRERAGLRLAWRGSIGGATTLAVLIWAWHTSRSISFDALEHLTFVAIVAASVLSVVGWPVFRKVLFPFGYLTLAIPLGGDAVDPLMEVTADLAAWVLSTFGVPAFRDGLLLVLPNGSFEVVEACSGVNYLSAGIAVGLLIGHLSFDSIERQVAFASFVAGSLVVMNGVRASIVIAVGNASDMTLLVGQDHVVFGWVLFCLLVLTFALIANRYSDRTA